MASVRAVLFDYGDTLGDLRVDEALVVEAYGEVRLLLSEQTSADVPAPPELVQGVTLRVMGIVNASYGRRELEELDALDLFSESLAELGIEVPRDTVQQVAEIEYRAMVAIRTIPPENLDALRRLRELGLKLGLVSNAHFLPSLMLEDFERLGLTELMDAIVTSSQTGLRKPHPAIFERILAELDVAPAEAVFVGDKVREDVAGPKELGLRAVLTHQFRQEELDPQRPPDAVIDSLSELVPYVEALLRTDTQVGA